MTTPVIPLTSLWLKFTLKSDATFGRGDGVAGMVNAEVQHDEYGMPYLGGKTLKGMLSAVCAEIMFALEQQMRTPNLSQWEDAAQFLFGSPGSEISDMGKMRVSDAQLPDDLRATLIAEFRLLQEETRKEERERQWDLQRRENLETLTALRRQTAMNPETGAPQRNSLRTMRVILRETSFAARLDFNPSLDETNLYSRWLLAACVRAFRRAGTGRNRGRGKLRAELFDRSAFDPATAQTFEVAPVTQAWLHGFEKEVQVASAHVSN